MLRCTFEAAACGRVVNSKWFQARIVHHEVLFFDNRTYCEGQHFAFSYFDSLVEVAIYVKV